MLRSNQHNRYYHSQIKVPLASYFGVDPEWMHEFLLIKFALIDVKDDHYEVESTAYMSVQRFSLFIENIWQWIVNNNIPLNEYKSIDEPTTIKIIER